MDDWDNDACCPCPPTCSSPFERVVVSWLIAGGTEVYYTLRPDFAAQRPLTFQLQVGQSANQEADDWTDVGAPVTDQLVLVDGEQHLYGLDRWTFYRVVLTCSAGKFYSDATGLMGVLDHRQWRLARAQFRSELVYFRAGDGEIGYLLKKRIAGPPCPHCLDPQTGEVKQPYCGYCFGTSFLCGYFFPMGCVWSSISPKKQHLTIDANRGTTGGIVCVARMLNVVMVSEGDIFVSKAKDDRWFVHSVSNVTEYRGVPLVADVELRLIPASDPTYNIVIPGQALTPRQLGREL